MKDRLRQVREELGYSQADFAQRIGANQTTVSRWEKGERSPSDIELRLVAKEFGFRYEWLKSGEGEKKQTYGEALTDMGVSLFRQLPEDAQEAVLKVLRYYAEHGRFPYDG